MNTLACYSVGDQSFRVGDPEHGPFGTHVTRGTEPHSAHTPDTPTLYSGAVSNLTHGGVSIFEPAPIGVSLSEEGWYLPKCRYLPKIRVPKCRYLRTAKTRVPRRPAK